MANVTISDIAGGEDTTPAGTAKLEVEVGGVSKYAQLVNLLKYGFLGAANLKYFMNAAGTAPEWASGIKIGTFSIDTATATGTQAVAGVGFKPSNIILFSSVASTTEFSIGFDNGTLHYGQWFTVAFKWIPSAVNSIYLYQDAGITYAGLVSVLGADGFTVSWTKAGAKVGTAVMYYIAFR